MTSLVKAVQRSLLPHFVKHRRGFGTSSVNMSKDLVVTERRGNVFLIGINRPEKRNCVNPETAVQLRNAFNEFEKNKDLWVAVFYGKGGYFCGGFDLKALSGMGDTNIGPPAAETEKTYTRPMGPSMMRFSKPVIGAIQGYAVAGGMELACLCDMRVVEQSAVMGVFCRRFGVPLLDGGTVRLPALIGLSRALDLILTGREVGSNEAKELGLANRVVPDGTAVSEAIQLAETLCHFPQECMRADRASAFHAAYDATSYDNAFTYEYQNGLKVVQRESVKGAQRFVSGVGRHGSFADFGGNKSKL